MSVSVRGIAFGDFLIHWYGIVIALGAVVAFFLSSAREKKFGLPRDTTLDIMLFALPAAIVGARLYYVAFSFDRYRDDLLSILNIREGGLAIYGGVIAAVIVICLICRARRLSIPRVLDLFAPPLALAQAFGRWGNFFNGEAYGAIEMPEQLSFFPLAVNIGGVWHPATFFYESAWCALVCLVLLLIERRGAFRKSGDEVMWYLFLYGTERALVESLRADSLMIGQVRVSLLLSGLLAVGITLVFARRARKTSLRFISPLLSSAAVAAAVFTRVTCAIPIACVSLVAAACLYSRPKCNIKTAGPVKDPINGKDGPL